MKIQKLLKSNEFMFFLVALVLFGFAVNTLGKKKNDMLEGLETEENTNTGAGADMGGATAAPPNTDPEPAGADMGGADMGGADMGGANMGGADMGSNTEPEDEEDETATSGVQGAMDEDSSAIAGTKVISSDNKAPTKPDELLPKDEKDIDGMPKKLPLTTPMIPLQTKNNRNSNLQDRSDPPVGKTDVGPWNQSTIEPDKTRRQFEIGSSSGEGDVVGWTRPCPFWMSNDISKQSEPLIPAGPFLSGTGDMPGNQGAAQQGAGATGAGATGEGATGAGAMGAGAMGAGTN